MIPVAEIEYWASLGNLQRVRDAISIGHDVNQRSANGYTALHAAALNGHIEVIRMLLKCQAKADARLDSGETPLDLAVIANQTEAVEILRTALQQ